MNRNYSQCIAYLHLLAFFGSFAVLSFDGRRTASTLMVIGGSLLLESEFAPDPSFFTLCCFYLHLLVLHIGNDLCFFFSACMILIDILCCALFREALSLSALLCDPRFKQYKRRASAWIHFQLCMYEHVVNYIPDPRMWAGFLQQRCQKQRPFLSSSLQDHYRLDCKKALLKHASRQGRHSSRVSPTSLWRFDSPADFSSFSGIFSSSLHVLQFTNALLAVPSKDYQSFLALSPHSCCWKCNKGQVSQAWQESKDLILKKM